MSGDDDEQRNYVEAQRSYRNSASRRAACLDAISGLKFGPSRMLGNKTILP